MTTAEIPPTRIWIESDLLGSRYVMVQRDGAEPFEYARFSYDYAYTSNAETFRQAEALARSLGAAGEIKHRHRDPCDMGPICIGCNPRCT